MTTTDPFAPRAQVDPDDFLMGGGATTAKFPVIGTEYTGIVRTKRAEQQRDYDDPSVLLVWKDGNPRMQVVVELECEPAGYTFDKAGGKVDLPDDDGMRSLYVKGQLQTVIRDAVRKAGAPVLEIGGRLTVAYVADGKQDNPRYNPPKIFSAVYYPAAQVASDEALMRGSEGAPNPFAQ